MGSGQPPRRTTDPSRATSLAGYPAASSHSGAASPRTMAAVEAALAVSQVSATTVAVRHVTRAEPPERGSTMWWTETPSAERHLRTVVDEVATAPWAMAITSASRASSGSIALSSTTVMRQPPSGARPAVAMSPPRLTRTPASGPTAPRAASAARSAARPLPVDPRSSSTSMGMRSVRAATSRSTVDQPGTVPVRRVRKGRSMRSRSRSKSASYPMTRSARPTVGSTAPPDLRAASSAPPTARASSGLAATVRPRVAWRRISSESGRNRE